MKKIILTSLISFGLLLGFGGLNTEASVTTDNVLESDEISTQAATTATLSPKNLSGRTNTWYTLTVRTNQSGSVSFTFNPGISGVKAKTYNGSVSRNFSQEWTTKNISTFTTSARVISQDYGPSPWVYGKAVISI